MEFGQLMADVLVYASYKFDMYIFEIAQVIGENVPIAFLYVLSIHRRKTHPDTYVDACRLCVHEILA